MRTIRAAMLAVAATALLFLTSNPARAQIPAVPAGTPVVVTGSIVALGNVDPGDLTRIDPIVEDGRHIPGVDCIRNQVWRHEAEFNDPRLAGTMTTTWNWDDFGAAMDVGPAWGAIAIENAGGTWTGTFTGVEMPDGTMDTHAWLVGSGAYEGLTAFLCLQCGSHGPSLAYDRDATHAWGATGVVYRGAPPTLAVAG